MIAAIYREDSFGEGMPQQLVVGPEGIRVSLDSLPAPDTKRWVARRKAEVVAAVKGGLLSTEEACRRYRLSEEEFQGWVAAVTQQGMTGLMHRRRQQKTGSSPSPNSRTHLTFAHTCFYVCR